MMMVSQMPFQVSDATWDKKPQHLCEESLESQESQAFLGIETYA